MNRWDYTPRSQFLPFHNRPHRWACLVTHRRAGKTVAVVNDVILAARTPLAPTTHPDPQYAYIGPTYTQAKRVAWGYLKRYSEPYWAKRPSESELKLTLATPIGTTSTVYCLGADNADSLRGMYLDGAMCDEYALWKPSVFSQVIRPALADRYGWATFASTPRGKNLFHAVYRLAQRFPSEYHLTLLRASTSGLLKPAELRDLMRHMDPEEFAQEFECSFDSALKGAIYASEVNRLFLDQRVTSTPLYDPHLDTHFVYDLGFTDSTVRIAYQLPPHSGRVHIVSVEAASGRTIFEHMDDIHSFGGRIGRISLPHDARAKNLQTGKSIVEQFLEQGLTPHIVPDHHVKDGIAAVRRLFPRLVVDGTPIDPGDPFGTTICGDFIEAAKTYHREWDEDKLCFTDKPVHDWSSDYMDALRYLAIEVAPDFVDLRSSDNALQSARETRVWTPSIGYNLETLHQDHRTLAIRTMP